MYFNNFSDFVAMGNHGLYVWLSYGIFLAVILWNVLLVQASREEALRLAKQAWRRSDAEKAGTDAEKINSAAEKIRSEVEKNIAKSDAEVSRTECKIDGKTDGKTEGTPE